MYLVSDYDAFVPVFRNIFGTTEVDEFTRSVDTTQTTRHQHHIAKECLETQNRGRIFDR